MEDPLGRSDMVAILVPTKRSKGGKGKVVTAFILFSSEVRKDRMQNNPDCTFGDISRMVGSEWRNMTAAEKQYWEEKAVRSNEENAIKYAEEQHQLGPPLNAKRSKGKAKVVTAYIVFSSEVRKDRVQNNPGCTFGDISRMVGNEWRNMTAAEKQYWEEKATRSNEENAIKYAEEHCI